MPFLKSLGNILIERGICTKECIANALEEQYRSRMRTEPPQTVDRSSLVSEARVAAGPMDQTQLGRLLVETGAISREQLQEALSDQARMVERLHNLDSHKLALVMQLGLIVNSTLNLAEVLQLIMTLTNEVTGSVASTMMLLDSQTGELVFSVPTGPASGELRDVRLPPGVGVAGWVASHHRPLLVPDVSKDSRFYSGIDQRTGFITKSILAVPMMAKNRCIGVLEVINRDDGSSFNSDDELYLTIFSAHAAMAIENARMFRELQNRHRSELAWQQRVAESEKLRSLGTLAAGVAHDFNNTLAAVVSFAGLAAASIPADHKAQDDLDNLLVATRQAKRMLAQIMDYARQSDSDRRPLSLAGVVRDALEQASLSLPEGVELRTDLPILAQPVAVNPAQLRQVVANICSNAGLAMSSGGGTLTVSLERIQVPEAGVPDLPLNPGAYQCLRFIDTGAGMDQQTMSRAFEPFFTTRREGGGTGMGLALVQSIVNAHGGAVSVESTPGQGSQFMVYLPEDEQAPPLDEREEGQPLPHGNERILLVDDERVLLGLGQRVLETLGYKVDTAPNGNEALRSFMDQPDSYDLVITDQVMPGLTGMEMAGEMLGKRPELPIILCTGYSDQINESDAMAAGLKRYLLKPVAVRELAFAVRQVLDGAAGLN